MKNPALPLLIFFGVLVLVLGLVFWQQQPESYHLHVVNNSSKVVDRVRLFGNGVLAESEVSNLQVGDSALVEVSLAAVGGLNFEVTQGLNRIDTFISEDVSTIEQLQQKLIIQTNHRFIISD